ncbi:MAG: maltose alpha-D-glucosyltransferase [Candidatus Omnitrophica bacterium]|nr:maltose alpha-D-glucosyltransferase [Candidatus Omnitrophota bacterium]
MKDAYIKNEPLWYKDAVIYELHVRAFYDTNGDGIGDFKGLTEKLDYLKGLGITAIWLLPFYPSPLKDDGYDISDYLKVHEDYGTLKDFKEFLKAAHEKGIRVIIELVLNHTSNEHAWFQRARLSKPGSKFRDFYVWSDSPNKYKNARIIFKDFETSNWTWDPAAKTYYWHRFYSHQPDLNYESHEVQKEVLRVIDFWFKMGVDGMRMDAVPYLCEREGTNCENLPETHAFLKKLRSYVDSKFKNKLLLAEANQWPEDAAGYFGTGDECHMAFHFPIMPRMFMSVQMEDSFPIIDILNSTPVIPESCQWAIFLRNHDELTLEMVTDEERDYMYRVYAKDPRSKINVGIRRRLSPLLGANRRKIELMNILLFSLPGTPVIYYGDELGMGDNYYLGDRNGVRTPMQWNPNRNAGFSEANPQRLFLPVIIDSESHYENINVENQERNLSSLLWWMKRVIAMRKKFKSFSMGNTGILPCANSRVLAFTREHGEEIMLVVANLSRFSQVAELDLSKYKGILPEEVFSQNRFPEIKESSYVLTLGPYNHYWLLLKKEKSVIPSGKQIDISEIELDKDWQGVLEGREREKLETEILPGYLASCRWFGSKAKIIRKIKIVENADLHKNHNSAHILLLEISYTEGMPEMYLLPVCFSPKEEGHRIMEEFRHVLICFLKAAGRDGILYDASYNERFREELLNLISQKKKIKGLSGEFIAQHGKEFKKILKDRTLPLASQTLKVEQSNTSLIYEDRFFLKLYRRLDEGENPELEISRFLTEKKGFKNTPLFAGAIEYRKKGSSRSLTAAVLQSYVINSGNAWQYAVKEVSGYFERVLARRDLNIEVASDRKFMHGLIGGMCLEMIPLLGKRTGELHLALGSSSGDETFSSEEFSTLYQRSLYQSMQGLLARTFQSLKKKLKDAPEHLKTELESIFSYEGEILKQMQAILKKKIAATKIRIHGDFHLGQVLWTGKDFVIMDFEGEPQRPLGERRLKHSPLKDIAGMLRSFHYAAFAAILLESTFRPEDVSILKSWVQPWYECISNIFLDSYLEAVRGASFVPAEKSDLDMLLNTFLLEKAVYELGYELNNRPDWIIIPIKGIENIMKKGG